MVTIKQVTTARDRREFIELPLRMYKHCPHFVPPLYSDEKTLLKSGGNSEYIESVFFLATKDGNTVGRIQGLIQQQYNLTHNTAQARFTRFDCIDDVEVARALIDTVETWAAEKGMTSLCGPLGFNDLDREGLLVEGFEELSTFEEQYNYAYYGSLLEQCGLRKDVDWLEFELTKRETADPMLARVAARTLEINKLHLADNSVSKKRYIERYRDSFFDCLDECYRDLYGTVPITKQAQDELIAQFMLLINKRFLILVCDETERVVAFGLCFPSIGKALQKSGGHLTPLTLLKILRAVHNPACIDLGLIAVRPAYQNTGVNAVILNFLSEALQRSDVLRCETNLNLETNTAVQNQWKYFHARQHKRRRAYIKSIGE